MRGVTGPSIAPAGIETDFDVMNEIRRCCLQSHLLELKRPSKTLNRQLFRPSIAPAGIETPVIEPGNIAPVGLQSHLLELKPFV